MPACGSPKLIAACHVLHRLLLPRHPPCALSSLTTKFTQHTQDQLLAPSFWLLAKTPFPNTPLKFYGPSLPAHRALNAYQCFRAPAGYYQALIKIYTPCNLPNLFSCQISSSLALPAARLGGYGSYSLRSVQTPPRLQPNVRRQATFMNREPNHGCRWTPNIGLTSSLPQLLRPGSIGIDSAFDLRQPLLMAVNHANDRDCATNQDCANRNQQTTQTEDSIHEIVHASVPSGAKAQFPWTAFAAPFVAIARSGQAQQLKSRPSRSRPHSITDLWWS
jgi:hypothetical protein